jgi:hypothetical protein
MCRLAAIVLAVLIAVHSFPTSARAQACCAGTSAVTPGRLELHEDALVGLQTRSAVVIGSYDVQDRYIASPSGDGEADLEQDLFGALRLLQRAQIALLVPMVETLRSTPQDGSHAGGGIGDVNVSARYDFLIAGESRLPGIALLAGITFPTGTPADAARSRLAVDATGVGAFQGNLALALEQTFGPWLANVTAMVAQRSPHGGETLGTQITFLGASGYTFSNEAALAVVVSYSFEGDASDSQGVAVPESAKSLSTFSLSLLWPISDAWRFLGGAFINPPAASLGSNQPAAAGLTLTLIRSWS